MRDLREQATSLGFLWVETLPVSDAAGYEQFRDWLAKGYHGTMRYLEERAEAYRHPRFVLEEAKTLIMLAMPYTPAESLRKKVSSSGRLGPAIDAKPPREPPSVGLRTSEVNSPTIPELSGAGFGRIAAYACGTTDYHDVIHDRLRKLKDWLLTKVAHAKVRGIVDTAPLLERDFAARAGLGWIGKNTLLLRRDGGSYFFLAALLTDLNVCEPADADRLVLVTDHCGTCTACLDACPTQAFPQARVLDASRCISYLTIEHRGRIEPALMEQMGDWILGCDVCQQVCPWNRMAVQVADDKIEGELLTLPEMKAIDLLAILRMSQEDFRKAFRATPLWRPRLQGLQRNAMIALANQGHTMGIDAIQTFVHSDDPVLQETARWALAKLKITNPRFED